MLVVDVLAKHLLERGVRFAFGMPGGATVPLMAALERVGIVFVLVRHEGSAGFMADAVFQRTGHLGVCISTLGPGATNLISGVAQAFTERSKVLAIVGQCEDHLRPLYTHQIIDQEAMFTPICHGYHRLRSHQPERHLQKIFQQVDGTAGPVVIELSTSVSNTVCNSVYSVVSPVFGNPPMDSLSRQILLSKKPMVIVGAEDLSMQTAIALRELVETTKIPVLTTYRAKGMVDENHDLAMGAIGLSPVVDAVQQAWIQTADLVVLVGFDMVEMRLNWLDNWIGDATVVSISNTGQPDIPFVLDVDWRGAIGFALSGLSEKLRGWKSQWHLPDLKEHAQRVHRVFMDTTSYDALNPATVIQHLQRHLSSSTVLSLDVGAHRITASHVWKCTHPRTLLQSNGFSSMGVGLPMAISVALHEPETTVVALTGDMGLWMSLGELGIIQERSLHVIVIYLSDSALSLIELKQERSTTPKRTGVRFQNPDTVSLAHSFGGHGFVCRTLEEIEDAVGAAQQNHGLHLIEIEVDPRYYRAQM